MISLEEQADEQRILHADLHRVCFHFALTQIADLVRLTGEPVEQVVDAVLSSIPDGPFRQDMIELRDQIAQKSGKNPSRIRSDGGVAPGSDTW